MKFAACYHPQPLRLVGLFQVYRWGLDLFPTPIDRCLRPFHLSGFEVLSPNHTATQHILNAPRLPSTSKMGLRIQTVFEDRTDHGTAPANVARARAPSSNVHGPKPLTAMIHRVRAKVDQGRNRAEMGSVPNNVRYDSAPDFASNLEVGSVPYVQRYQSVSNHANYVEGRPISNNYHSTSECSHQNYAGSGMQNNGGEANHIGARSVLNPEAHDFVPIYGNDLTLDLEMLVIIPDQRVENSRECAFFCNYKRQCWRRHHSNHCSLPSHLAHSQLNSRSAHLWPRHGLQPQYAVI